MLEKIENILLKIEKNKGKTIDDELVTEAQDLLKNLKEEFRKNVINEFSYYLEKSYFDCKRNRKFIKNVTSNVKFVDEFAYLKGSFIENYWYNIPEMIDILKDYVKELESQEAEEQKEQCTEKEN